VPHTVRITLEGLPERVNEIADSLEALLPDTFEWQDFAAAGAGFEISLRGIGSWDLALIAKKSPPLN
jgi:uncharacterized protein YaiE (UPF0345 family)